MFTATVEEDEASVECSEDASSHQMSRRPPSAGRYFVA